MTRAVETKPVFVSVIYAKDSSHDQNYSKSIVSQPITNDNKTVYMIYQVELPILLPTYKLTRQDNRR